MLAGNLASTVSGQREPRSQLRQEVGLPQSLQAPTILASLSLEGCVVGEETKKGRLAMVALRIAHPPSKAFYRVVA